MTALLTSAAAGLRIALVCTFTDDTGIAGTV
jgi:hypothetical protein